MFPTAPSTWNNVVHRRISDFQEGKITVQFRMRAYGEWNDSEMTLGRSAACISEARCPGIGSPRVIAKALRATFSCRPTRCGRFFLVANTAEEAEDPIAQLSPAEYDYRHKNETGCKRDDDQRGGEDLSEQGVQAPGSACARYAAGPKGQAEHPASRAGVPAGGRGSRGSAFIARGCRMAGCCLVVSLAWRSAHAGHGRVSCRRACCLVAGP